MSPSILVVDDLPNWRSRLLDVLSYGGYSAEAVSSSKEAKQALASGQFRLAVIDIRLVDADDANMEGLELLEEIDAADLDVKVIVMTGYRTILEEQRARQSPRLVDFIDKEEFDIHHFLKMVEAAISTNTSSL